MKRGPKNNYERDGWPITAAARELGVGANTVRNAIELGQLKTFKPFGLKYQRIPDAEIRRVKEQLR